MAKPRGDSEVDREQIQRVSMLVIDVLFAEVDLDLFA